MDIQKRIRNLMQQRGIESIYELSKRSSVPQSTLQNIFSGKDPQTKTLGKICNGLNITLAEFFTETSTNKPVCETYDEKIKNLPEKDRKIIDTIIEVNKPKEEQAATAEGG